MRGRATGVAALFSLFACAASEPAPAPGAGAPPAPPTAVEARVCEEPRPEVCTREYRPVCADRDTGIRCITTPCPSSERVTYSNACTACSDAKVMRHTPGACEPNDK